jgi:hypothetical protein
MSSQTSATATITGLSKNMRTFWIFQSWLETSGTGRDAGSYTIFGFSVVVNQEPMLRIFYVLVRITTFKEDMVCHKTFVETFLEFTKF